MLKIVARRPGPALRTAATGAAAVRAAFALAAAGGTLMLSPAVPASVG